jgi:hypothetical protein
MMPRRTPAARFVFIAMLAFLLCASRAGLDAQSQGGSQTRTEPQDQGEKPQPADEHDAAPVAGLFVRAFGAFNWGATNQRGVPNSFALGQFALFATSTLSERVSVLAEVVLEGSRSTQVVVDLERLQLTFRLDDRLHMSAGRYHTGIGYYNSAFHHGSYFETLIGRPRVFAFEDEGGVLPVHEVGISAGGTVPGTGSALVYLAEVGNGRSWNVNSNDPDAVEGPADNNSGKSTNVGASFRPGRWRGFEIGTSYYRDLVPDADVRPVAHRIATAYLTYKTPSIEIMTEWLRLSHRTEQGVSYANRAGYIQASRAWGRLRPYYRYDRLTIDPATPFIGQIGSYSANIIGLRVDPGQWVGLKAQYERTNEARQQGINSVRAELVFVF